MDADLVALNTKEAAQFLGLQASTLVVWRARGLGPRCCYSGAKPVYYLPVLRAWQEECRARIKARPKRVATFGKKLGRPKTARKPVEKRRIGSRSRRAEHASD